jgi:hypothetical protein
MTTFTLKNDSSKVDSAFLLTEPLTLPDGTVLNAGSLPYSINLHPEFTSPNNDPFTFRDALIGRVNEALNMLSVFSDSSLIFDGSTYTHDGKTFKLFTSSGDVINGGVVGTIPPNNGSGNISLTSIFVDISGYWLELNGTFSGTTASGLTSASITSIVIGSDSPAEGEAGEYRIAGTLTLSANGFWSGSLFSLSAVDYLD